VNDVMQERYGTRSPRRRLVLVVATTVLAAVFLAWLVWAAWFNSDSDLDAEVASFRVVNDHQVDIRVQMHVKDDSVRGSCTFGATARDHSPVGDRTLTVAQIKAANGGWISIPTLSRATTVEKTSCTQD
jgi:hypothetical protein